MCINQDPNSRLDFSTICDQIHKNIYDLHDESELEKHEIMQKNH